MLFRSGIVTAFGSATNAATASLTPTAAGSFTVRLTVTDGSGATEAASATITVAAAPVLVTPPVVQPTSSGGGGGAASLWWVLGVLLAVALLHTWRPQAAVQRKAAPQ